MNRAKSNLCAAEHLRDAKDVYPEDICFNAQQAVQKALKGVLIGLGRKFPKTHNIDVLVSLILLAEPRAPAAALTDGAQLTEYAHGLRYPGWHDAPNEADVDDAIRLTKSILAWAQKQIRRRRRKPGRALK